MKNDILKNCIIGFFSVATVILLVLNATMNLPKFWAVNISEGIEIFILVFVTYFLVERQDNKNRKKEKLYDVILKIQNKLMDPDLIRTDTDVEKKITMIKFTSITNYIEIIKDNADDLSTIELIVNEMDNLSAIVLDHIDDKEYIEKSNPQIVRVLTSIDTKLQKLVFEIR